MKKIIILLFSACLFAQLCCSSTMTMNEAIELAYKQRPSLRALKSSTEVAHMIQKRNIAGYLPQLSARNILKLIKRDKGLHNTFSFHAEQLVFSFASPLDLYSIAKKDTQAARIAELAHKDLIRNEVEISFLQSWLLQKQYPQVMAQAYAARTNFEREKDRNRVELLDRNDWLNRNVLYSEQITDASLYKNNLEIAQSTLERVLGAPLSTSLFPPRSNDLQATQKLKLNWNPHQKLKLQKISSYYQLALQHRKEIMIKQKEIEREKLTEYYTYARNFPSISLIGDVSRTDVLRTRNFRMFSEVGMQIDWNIFDGLFNYHESEASRARKIRAHMEKESIIQKVREDVQTTHQIVKQDIKLLKVAKMSLLQAKNEYDLRKQELKIGQIAQPDLDRAQFNYKNAQFAWLSQRIRAQISKQNLLFACGYPSTIS